MAKKTNPAPADSISAAPPAPPADEGTSDTPSAPGETAAPAESADKSPEPRLRQGNAPLCPYCTKKNGEGKILKTVVCKSVHSEAFFTRYQCPTPGCPFQQKIARQNIAQRLAASQPEDFSAR